MKIPPCLSNDVKIIKCVQLLCYEGGEIFEWCTCLFPVCRWTVNVHENAQDNCYKFNQVTVCTILLQDTSDAMLCITMKLALTNLGERGHLFLLFHIFSKWQFTFVCKVICHVHKCIHNTHIQRRKDVQSTYLWVAVLFKAYNSRVDGQDKTCHTFLLCFTIFISVSKIVWEILKPTYWQDDVE